MASQSPRTALIGYGSETGTAQDAAEEIGRLTKRLRFMTRVSELNAIALNDLVRTDITIIAIATTGQGDLPANAQAFWTKLRSPRLKSGTLSRVRFTSFGIGDSSYSNFNWAHRKLSKRLLQLGAQCIFDLGESDDQHPDGLDGLFMPWAAKLREQLLHVYPFPNNVEPLPEQGFLEPDWELQFVSDPANNHDAIPNDSIQEPSQTNGLNGNQPNPNTPPSTPQIPATLISSTRLTPATHFQDVRLFTFTTLPHITYSPGDTLTIYPHNDPTAVTSLLDLMNWNHIADAPIHLIPTTPSPPLLPSITLPTTLRHLLTTKTDLNAIPRRSFFSALLHFTSDATQKERLTDFTRPELVDELWDYTTRPRRSVLEVLQEFYTVRLPWQWVLTLLPPIRGRQFSIASGGALKVGDGRTRFELLIAMVEYRTVIKKVRRGLCTHYLASLGRGAEIQVSLGDSGMRVALDRPAIMVGPGTGVAPLRSMIHERAARLDVWQRRWMLFFGGRNREADFFFEGEWGLMRALEVVGAFSRDQKEKIYVQDEIVKRAESVYGLLEAGAVVYVCGSSGNMPKQVRLALVEVVRRRRGVEEGEAERYIGDMEKGGRYQQETW